MEVRVIRGYRLKLWRERLGLSQNFVSEVDLAGLNLVFKEKLHPDHVEIILFTKMRGQKNPIPTLIRIPNEHKDALIERVTIGRK